VVILVKVVVVGVCASGKSTLVRALRGLGIDAHNVAQEHSGIRQLWKKKNPDMVVMLDATIPVIRKRREVYWGEERLIAQRERLTDARRNADLFIQTDTLNRNEVLQLVLERVGRKLHHD
jgi:deoxyadenosine/deoxycytidine kinase